MITNQRRARIGYISGGRSVPTVRFRLAFVDLLRERGHVVAVFHAIPSRYDFFKAIGWRLSQKFRMLVRYWHLLQIQLSRYDAVILETGFVHTSDASLELQLRAVSTRLVFEIDDAVFLLFPEKLKLIAELADHVIAGNRDIAAWAQKYCSSVSIIPTCVDIRTYQPKDYNRLLDHAKPVVGWIGSHGNLPMLNVCVNALRRAYETTPFELHIVTAAKHHNDAVDLAGLDVKWIDIDRCDVVRQLQMFDVGLMPLPDDDPWMCYKCNAKMIQYMAVAVPAIASKIGFNLEIVTHGVNSMLAQTEAEWESALVHLLSNRELRQQLGLAARDTVLERYTVQSSIEQYERSVLGTL